MSIKAFTFGDDADAAPLNDLADDIQRTFEYGATTPELEITSAAAAYPGTPDFQLDLDPIIGDYLACIFQFKATAGTASIKAVLNIGGVEDTIFEITTTSTSYGTPAAGSGKEVDLVTGLTNIGDATGRHGTLGFYLKCSGGGTISVKNLRVASGSSGSVNDYLT